MKLKKLTSVLLALIMLTQLLPLSVFSDDSEELLEYTISEEYTYTSDDDTDNDDLLDSYVEQLFSASSNSGIMVASTYSGTDALANVPVALDMYNALKEGVAKIASGDETSSIIEIYFEYTYSELGADNFSDAATEFNTELSNYFNSVIRYLLADCPYEMYWYDKTAGVVSSGGSIYGSGSYLFTTISFTFEVASGYQDSTTETPEHTVNSSKAAAAVKAAANAQSVASSYSSYSDTDKITAFKEYICGAVSYESDYDGADYGDIWQLVYVFDGDTSTDVVCEGYSKAFQYLCDLSGLYCITVTGYMSGGTGGGDHMWNVLYLDGVNYLIDVTNSDSGTVGQSGGLFMVTDEDAAYIDYNGWDYIFYVGSITTTAPPSPCTAALTAFTTNTSPWAKFRAAVGRLRLCLCSTARLLPLTARSASATTSAWKASRILRSTT